MNETDDLDQLERQTAQLRRQMALDIDEVVRRVNPRRSVSTAVAYTRKTQRALRATAHAMKQDPIPYLMIGGGAAGTVWAATSLWRLRSQESLPIKEAVRPNNLILPALATKPARVAQSKGPISPDRGTMTDEAETPTARLKYRREAGKTYCCAYIKALVRIAF
jgi:hypothetical protein